MNRTIRLFVSSTFSDFRAERDLLQREVFPKLQQLCLSKGLRFQAIDLRWGVPEEAGKDNRTMRICQRELNRCQQGPIKPNFLVLLGDRYGWRPLPEIIPADVFKEIRRVFTTKDTKSTKLLDDWYRRDENALPPEYVLRPRTGRFEDFSVWSAEVERPLLAALEQAAEDLRADPSLSAELREALDRVSIGTSATEQEILKGALDLDFNEVRDHVHAFSRTVTDAPSPSNRDFADFLPEGLPDDQAEERLAELKTKLSEHLGGESNFHDYSVPWQGDGKFTDADLESFANQVLDCLTTVITAQVAALQGVSQEEQEEQAHRTFCEERRNGFHGRRGSLDSIATYLREGPAQPLAIVGPTGCGKSALMAEAVHRARESSQTKIQNSEPEIALSRFIGVTPGSSDLIELLRDLVACIRRRYPKETGTGVPPVSDNPETRDSPEPPDSEIPFEINPLTIAFHESLGRATAERPLWLFLDALDQFRDANLAASLSWLPQKLPPYVRIVVSAAEPSEHGTGVPPVASDHRLSPTDLRQLILHNLARLCPGTQTLRLDPLTPADGEALLKHWLKAAGRTLDESQRKPILDAFAVEGNALWLRVAAEEATRWPWWPAPEPPPAPKSLPPDLHELLATVLERLSRNEEHGAVFVKRALGYLACARHGLAEDEIIGVLGVDPAVMADIIARSPTERVKAAADRIKALPVAIWVRFHGDIAFYLSERQNQGAALFGFYHRSFGEAVERFCLKTHADQLPLHETMARWFGAQPWFLLPAGEGGQPPRAPERPDPANTRKASELPFHLQRVAELTSDADLWDPLVDVLCDLDCVETKARSGLIYELVGDYNAALTELPEFRDENEHLTKRDAAMIAYNKALREYAVVRCDWWFAKERGETRPEPRYPPMPEELRDDAACAIPEQVFPRAARLRHFANFVSSNLTFLARFPGDTLPLAHNWADGGPVAMQAETQMPKRKQPWLKRAPCQPTQPLRPQCMRIIESHGSAVLHVSASMEGLRTVSGNYDATLQLWDIETGACLRTFSGHRDQVWSVSMCPDGHCAVSGSADHTVRLWNIESGNCLRTFEGHADKVWSVSVSPDGRCAISGSADKTLRVWDLKTGHCLRTLEGHADLVRTVSVSPDGRRAVSGSADKTLRVWDLETGICLRTLEGHTNKVSSVSVSPDGRRAVSGGFDETLRVWDIETGVCLLTLEGHRLWVSSVVVSIDGRFAVSGSYDETLRVWDLKTGACVCILEGHSDRVLSVCTTLRGGHVVSGGFDRTIRLWNLEARAPKRTIKAHNAGVRDVSAGPVGCRAVSGSSDRTIRLWDVETGACRLTLEGHNAGVRSVSISPDGRHTVSGSNDRTIRLWNLETGQCLRTIEGHRDWVNSVSVSPDGRCAISGSADKTVRLWDLETGACLRTLEGHRDWVNSVSFSSDGRRAVSGSADHTVRLWDILTGVCLRTLEGHCVILIPNGHRAVSGCLDQTIRLWDLETGTCLRTLKGHSSGVTCLSVSLNGCYVVSGSNDRTIRLWDLETGEQRSVHDTSAHVESASFSADVRRIICGTRDGQMHFLTPVNFPPSGPPILTPVRLWLFGDKGSSGHWDDRLTACCPHCGQRFPVGENMMGQQIACPLDSCGKPLQLNPFVVDGREK